MHAHLAAHAPDQRRVVLLDRDELRDRPPVLRDYDPVRRNGVEEREAPSLELRGGDLLHAPRIAAAGGVV